MKDIDALIRSLNWSELAPIDQQGRRNLVIRAVLYVIEQKEEEKARREITFNDYADRNIDRY